MVTSKFSCVRSDVGHDVSENDTTAERLSGFNDDNKSRARRWDEDVEARQHWQAENYNWPETYDLTPEEKKGENECETLHTVSS